MRSLLSDKSHNQLLAKLTLKNVSKCDVSTVLLTPSRTRQSRVGNDAPRWSADLLFVKENDTMTVKFRRLLAIARKHGLNGVSKRISSAGRLCVLQSFAEIRDITMRIADRPKSRSRQAPFAGH